MKQSAGILLYREQDNVIQFLLVHPGGPFFTKKNEGAWTIPKGELLTDEDPLKAALREFEEETGYTPFPPFLALQPIIQKGGKEVLCWAAKGDFNATEITSNTFTIEWPPKSGKITEFPEVDKAGWFNIEEARKLINERQIPLLEEIIYLLTL